MGAIGIWRGAINFHPMGGHQISIGTLYGGGGTYFNNWSGLEKYFNEYTLGPLEEDIKKSECFLTFDRVKL